MSKIFSTIMNEHEALNKNDQEISSQDIFQEYFEELKLMQNDLLLFLENSDNDQKVFKKLLSTINILKGNNTGEKLEQFFQLLLNIAQILSFQKFSKFSNIMEIKSKKTFQI